MGKQCKYAKKARPIIGGPTACCCTSPSNPKVSKGMPDGLPAMGWIDGTGWWNLCINGKSLKGVTPSKCDYYR